MNKEDYNELATIFILFMMLQVWMFQPLWFSETITKYLYYPVVVFMFLLNAFFFLDKKKHFREYPFHEAFIETKFLSLKTYLIIQILMSCSVFYFNKFISIILLLSSIMSYLTKQYYFKLKKEGKVW